MCVLFFFERDQNFNFFPFGLRCCDPAPDTNRLFPSGPCRGTKRLVSGWPTLPAILPEPGRLLLGTSALPHSGLGLPAPVFPSPLPAIVSAILPEPGLGLFPLVGPLPLHQLHPSTSAGSMALAEVALRGGGAPVTVTPGSEPRPPSGVPSCPSAAARSRGRCCSSRGRSLRDAPGPPRPGGSAGELFLASGFWQIPSIKSHRHPRARTRTL